MRALRFCLVPLLAALCAPAQDLKQFEKSVTEFTLANGLHFIVVERHGSPVVSFHTYVNAGWVDDPSGATGIAHMFERLAFKGTETIGTRNWQEEKPALDQIEAVYTRLEAERDKGPKADRRNIEQIENQLRVAIDVSKGFVAPDEFARIVAENGGVGLNAKTNTDSTEYSLSLPSNHIELWFLLESQRLLHPVFREFYKERDALAEENRAGVELNPRGNLLQEFRAAAFAAHPYRNPPGGWPSDVANLRAPDARRFFERYYVPGNMTIAIVGDVDPAAAKAMAERYFGPLTAHPPPPRLHTGEPPQAGPKAVVVESAAKPLLVLGYKRPDEFDKDDPVFDVAAMLLSIGRASLMYRDLVRDKRLANAIEVLPTYPGGRYPGLFVFYAEPAPGRTAEENEKELDGILDRFKSQKVDAKSLARLKTQARMSVIRRLDDNTQLAGLMAASYGVYGDWRRLFSLLDDYANVTAEDLQRVARKYFTLQNRTLAYSAPPAAVQPAAAGARP